MEICDYDMFTLVPALTSFAYAPVSPQPQSSASSMTKFGLGGALVEREERINNESIPLQIHPG